MTDERREEEKWDQSDEPHHQTTEELLPPLESMEDLRPPLGSLGKALVGWPVEQMDLVEVSPRQEGDCSASEKRH
jgi:hypothetical protein